MFIDTITVLTLKSKFFIYFSINNKLCNIVYICIILITPIRECIQVYILTYLTRNANRTRSIDGLL